MNPSCPQSIVLLASGDNEKNTSSRYSPQRWKGNPQPYHPRTRKKRGKVRYTGAKLIKPPRIERERETNNSHLRRIRHIPIPHRRGRYPTPIHTRFDPLLHHHPLLYPLQQRTTLRSNGPVPGDSIRRSRGVRCDGEIQQDIRAGGIDGPEPCRQVAAVGPHVCDAEVWEPDALEDGEGSAVGGGDCEGFGEWGEGGWGESCG